MSELSFLIDLLLNGRLSVKTKALVQQRIAFVETNMSLPQAIKQQQRMVQVQASLEPLAHVAPVTKRIVGGEVSTGNNTKGPRKF